MVKQYGNWVKVYGKDSMSDSQRDEVAQLIEHSLREGITGKILSTETIVENHHEEGWCKIAVKMNVEEAA